MAKSIFAASGTLGKLASSGFGILLLFVFL